MMNDYCMMYLVPADEMASTQTSHLKKQLLEYKDENNALKSAIARLNGELSRYQAKFRPLSAAEVSSAPRA